MVRLGMQVLETTGPGPGAPYHGPYRRQLIAPPEPDVVTPPSWPPLFTMAPSTISERIADGSIPATKDGKGWRIHWPTIRAVLDEGAGLFTPR